MKLIESEYAITVDRYDPVTGRWFKCDEIEFDYMDQANEYVEARMQDDINDVEVDDQFIKYRIIDSSTYVYEPRIPLTEDEVRVAVSKMKTYCDMQNEDGYKPTSARSALEACKYEGDDLEQVLQAIYDAGFTYCFDHKFLSSDGMGEGHTEYPNRQVCYWGPDQLKSRLECIRTY